MTQKLISMSCPSCGGRLQVGLETQQFVCAHCGAEWRVARGEGTIALQPITQQLDAINVNTSGIKQSSDRIASELAITRLQKDIENLDAQLASEYVNYFLSEIPLSQPRRRTLSNNIFRLLIFVVIIPALAWAWAVSESFTRTGDYSGSLSLSCVLPVGIALGYLLLDGWYTRNQSNRSHKQFNDKRSAAAQAYQTRKEEIQSALAVKHAELARHRRILSE